MQAVETLQDDETKSWSLTWPRSPSRKGTPWVDQRHHHVRGGRRHLRPMRFCGRRPHRKRLDGAMEQSDEQPLGTRQKLQLIDPRCRCTDFDGRSATISASNEYQAMQHWLQDGWGEGVLMVELDLDVLHSGLTRSTRHDEDHRGRDGRDVQANISLLREPRRRPVRTHIHGVPASTGMICNRTGKAGRKLS